MNTISITINIPKYLGSPSQYQLKFPLDAQVRAVINTLSGTYHTGCDLFKDKTELSPESSLSIYNNQTLDCHVIIYSREKFPATKVTVYREDDQDKCCKHIRRDNSQLFIPRFHYIIFSTSNSMARVSCEPVVLLTLNSPYIIKCLDSRNTLDFSEIVYPYLPRGSLRSRIVCYILSIQLFMIYPPH